MRGASEAPTLPPAILVWSGKGGVGKSTVAAHFTVALKSAGLRVGFFDADLHGPSAPRLFGVSERMGVVDQRIQPVDSHGIPVVSSGLLAGPAHPLVWQGLLLQGALEQLLYETEWSDCELIVVDLPPGTGEIQTTLLSQLEIVDTVVVTTPHDIAFDDVLRSVHLLLEANCPVGAVLTNLAAVLCPCCGHEFTPFSGTAAGKLAELFPNAVELTGPLESPAGIGSVQEYPLSGMMRTLAPFAAATVARVRGGRPNPVSD